VGALGTTCLPIASKAFMKEDANMSQVAGKSNHDQAQVLPVATALQSDVKPEEMPHLQGGGLTTLHADGSRKWLKPRLSEGKFWQARRIVAYVLILLFTAIPYMSMNGKPLMLIDLTMRKFTLLGKTFLPTDTLLLSLLCMMIALGVFWVTALWGRVWCGWGCPQTVYMEYVYRPIERFFEGAPGRPKKTKGVQGWLQQSGFGMLLKYVVYFVISCYLAHTFLAYFVGVEKLRVWVTQSPFEHPTPFIVMTVVTALMMLDFSFFREQICLVVCPYGRMQSVMIDRQSMIISYDRKRGEPRGVKKKAGTSDVSLPVLAMHDARTADCVDCKMCVTTCPTGIDIRNGLQMECINCAQCIDACDSVMTKLNRPTGLIRYASQAVIDGEKPKLLRARVLLYPVIMIVLGVLFIGVLMNQAPSYIAVLRGTGAPFYTLPSGEVANPVKLKLINRTEGDVAYTVTSTDGIAQVRIEDKQITLKPGELRQVSGIIVVQPDAFVNGTYNASVRVRASDGYAREVTYRLLGPSRDHRVKGVDRDRDEKDPSPGLPVMNSGEKHDEKHDKKQESEKEGDK
jgi:cytochrome c oxidase accessory protein FixG